MAYKKLYAASKILRLLVPKVQQHNLSHNVAKTEKMIFAYLRWGYTRVVLKVIGLRVLCLHIPLDFKYFYIHDNS
jgi:hypothetical protein